MLESECKGNVYQMSTYKFKDKETGQDVAIINLKYIYKGREDTSVRVGYDNGETNVQYSEEIFNKIKNDLLLKSVNLKFRLEPDFRDSTKYNSKLVAINDLVIKQ